MTADRHGARIGEIAGKPQYGWTTKARADGTVKLLRTTDITSGSVDWSTVPGCDQPPPSIGKYELRPGDIVVSRAGSVGFSHLIDDGCPPHTVFASYLMRIKPDRTKVLPEYLADFLTSPQYWQMVSDASVGVGLANVNGTKLAAMKLPLPDLTRQEEIVQLLGSLKIRSAEVRSHLAKARHSVKQFHRAVLAAGCAGRLTEGWRAANQATAVTGTALAEHTLQLGKHAQVGRWKVMDIEGLSERPDGWGVAPFAGLTDNFDGGRVPVRASDRKQRQGTYPYYGASGVIDHVDSYLFDGEYLLISEDGANLLARTTPIAFIATGQFWVNNHAHVVQGKPGILIEYLEMVINSINLEAYITGSAQPKLTQGALNELPIPVPSTEEQAEIVKQVRSLLAIAARVHNRINVARLSIDRSTRSILGKTFAAESAEDMENP